MLRLFTENRKERKRSVLPVRVRSLAGGRLNGTRCGPKLEVHEILLRVGFSRVSCRLIATEAQVSSSGEPCRGSLSPRRGELAAVGLAEATGSARVKVAFRFLAEESLDDATIRRDSRPEGSSHPFMPVAIDPTRVHCRRLWIDYFLC